MVAKIDVYLDENGFGLKTLEREQQGQIARDRSFTEAAGIFAYQ